MHVQTRYCRLCRVLKPTSTPTQMPRGSYLVNYARGNVVDIDATAAALKSGQLAGAAFDVYPEEVC